MNTDPVRRPQTVWPVVATWCCVLTPLLLLAALITLAVHVRVGLGHWPERNVEHYSTESFDLHFRLVYAVYLLAVYVAIPLWAVLLAFRRFRVSLRFHLLQALVYLLSWGAFVAYCLIDPGRFVGWLLD